MLKLTHSGLMAIVCGALSGCTLAPNYERPAAPVSQQWPASPTPSPAGKAAAELDWRDFFQDARLQATIALALDNNRDLRVATLNVARVQALYRVQRAALFPEIDASGTGTRSRTPADLSATGRTVTGSSYQVGLGASAYELDLFGRVQSLRDEQLEQYFATEEARRSAQISLVAQVANQYVVERANAERQEIAQGTLDSLEKSLALTERQFEAGVVSELDLRTVESQVQTARADLASYTQAHAQAINALVLLTGAPLPDNLPPAQALASHRLVDDLPAGLPSELLTRRPDILEAEHQLKSANASIGAARAAFFPSIRLTVFGGTSSAELDGLFKQGSGAWSFSPQVTLPIFAGGRNRANLDAAKLEKQIEIAQYEKAIQTAFREVADELVAQPSIRVQVAAQTARVAAEQRRYALATERYQQGVDSYVVLLTAQRDLFSAQQLLIQAQQARLTSLINLYKALGGGWSNEPAAGPAASRSAAGRAPGSAAAAFR